MRKVAKKLCKLSLFSQLSAPIKSGVRDIKLKRSKIIGSPRSGQYRDVCIHASCDIKVKMVYFSRCTGGIKVRMNKLLLAASPISLKTKRIGARAVRSSEVHTRHGLENAACSF